MKIKTFCVNPFAMNCYIYYDEASKDGIIIDPGAYNDFEKEEISSFVDLEMLNINFILNTHGHIDHILGNAWTKEKWNVPLLMHKDDLPLIENSLTQGAMFGVVFHQPPMPDKFVDESNEIKFANTILKIIHTPGHSPGSVCFVDEKEKLIFGGDCLFRGSVGRTDLWLGDMDVLLDSIQRKMFAYCDDFVVYPGHMEETTLGWEKKTNPFLVG